MGKSSGQRSVCLEVGCMVYRQFDAISVFIQKTQKRLAAMDRVLSDFQNWRKGLKVGRLSHRGDLLATSSTLPETLTLDNLQAITWTMSGTRNWINTLDNQLVLRTHLPVDVLGILVESHVGTNGPLSARDVLTHNQQVSLAFSNTQKITSIFTEGLQNDTFSVIVSLNTDLHTGTLPAGSVIKVYELI